MMSYINNFWKFLNYWYFRYLMVTELYMVEKWERVVCNMTIIIVLSVLSYFNCTLLQYTSKLLFNSSVDGINDASAT